MSICSVVIQASQLCSSSHDWVDEVGLIVVGHLLQYLRTPGARSMSEVCFQQHNPLSFPTVWFVPCS